ncbi:MAG TPA: 50S ribosomal protein L11 methyltransferase [Methylomirabilota bacterium]|nr:50S ribosomal protein L11 methyltransferase [Methylomirabilota bacterium]
MPFWQLTVPTLPETSDGLTNFLWEQGALGVVEEESPTEPARLRAFFADTASSTELLRAVSVYRASLRTLGLPVAAAEAEISPLLDAAWAQAWQQSFPPREVGRRLLVVPPWEATSEAGERLRIVIEPGRAFGTGHHGSTEGCLVLLEEALEARPGARVLDIGTGTGILAVAAIQLGAAEALAIDVDPDAVAAARKNAAANDCGRRLSVEPRAPGELPSWARWPVVVANLLTQSHLALAGTYTRLVEPAGSLILGGVLADEEARIIAALESAGWAVSRRVVVDGWSSMLLSAPAAARGARPA